jgi:hypothetical protein
MNQLLQIARSQPGLELINLAVASHNLARNASMNPWDFNGTAETSMP